MSEAANTQTEREGLIKNYQVCLDELEQYKAAFNHLHSFVAGLSLEPHVKYCMTVLPGSSSEQPGRCATCEAETYYRKYAYLYLQQLMKIQHWSKLPQQDGTFVID